MKTNTRLYMGLTGAMLVIMGLICLLRPFATMYTMATVIGAIILVSGFSTLFLWIKTRFYLPTGNMLLSAILQIFLGLLFLSHKSVLVTTIPVLFAFWMLIEGVVLAIRSFDFRRAGYGAWWVLCILGAFAAVMGFEAIKQPMEVGSSLLSTFMGVGLIALGVIDITALFGLKKVTKRHIIWTDEIDEQ